MTMLLIACPVQRLPAPDTIRFHDLRATHETLLLDAGVPVHVVAARCGHDPAVLLRVYAKRTRKADTSAAAVIGALSKGALGGQGQRKDGGWGGIRTLGGREPTLVFKTSALNHSATHPVRRLILRRSAAVQSARTSIAHV